MCCFPNDVLHGHSDYLSLVDKTEGNFQTACLLRILSTYYGNVCFLHYLLVCFHVTVSLLINDENKSSPPKKSSLKLFSIWFSYFCHLLLHHSMSLCHALLLTFTLIRTPVFSFTFMLGYPLSLSALLTRNSVPVFLLHLRWFTHTSQSYSFLSVFTP